MAEKPKMSPSTTFFVFSSQLLSFSADLGKKYILEMSEMSGTVRFHLIEKDVFQNGAYIQDEVANKYFL
jgi:hypothetical protein